MKLQSGLPRHDNDLSGRYNGIEGMLESLSVT